MRRRWSVFSRLSWPQSRRGNAAVRGWGSAVVVQVLFMFCTVIQSCAGSERPQARLPADVYETRPISRSATELGFCSLDSDFAPVFDARQKGCLSLQNPIELRALRVCDAGGESPEASKRIRTDDPERFHSSVRPDDSSSSDYLVDDPQMQSQSTGSSYIVLACRLPLLQVQGIRQRRLGF